MKLKHLLMNVTLKILIASLLMGLSGSISCVYADSLYSLRARPIGLASGIYGLEGFWMLNNDSIFQGLFVGPTFHAFQGNDDPKQTALTNYEIGIKFGKLFQMGAPNRGWFVMGNLNLYKTQVSQYYAPQSRTLTAEFAQLGEAVFVGYQWPATLIGEHWDLRLGVGAVFKEAYVQYFDVGTASPVQVGARKRWDPTLEYTMGYTF